MHNSIIFYKVNCSEIICCKRIKLGKEVNIIFIDVATDGLLFSHTIPKNFSIRNIENFLKTKFKNYARLNNST